jgi:hypothetical protein
LVGDKELGSTRAETAAVAALKEDDKPALKKTSTMAQTAKEGEEFLARQQAES